MRVLFNPSARSEAKFGSRLTNQWSQGNGIYDKKVLLTSAVHLEANVPLVRLIKDHMAQEYSEPSFSSSL